jgi:hypothetical protein
MNVPGVSERSRQSVTLSRYSFPQQLECPWQVNVYYGLSCTAVYNIFRWLYNDHGSLHDPFVQLTRPPS